MEMYSIQDQKSGEFTPPFVSPNNATAMRSFESTARNASGDLQTHPEDFALWHIGSFDQFEGTVKAVPRKCLGHASDFFVGE